LHRTGGPEALSVDEVAVETPGPGEVRIAVHAIGLNRVESMFRGGDFGAPAFPARIGYEAAGVVEALGEGASGFKPGDRVAVLPGIEMGRYGSYGEQMCCPAGMLVKLPDAQDFVTAAATWMQYLTAYAIIEVGQIRAGDAVVITAASSSVGLAAIQLARDAGATAIAVTRGRSKVEALKAHGADHVVVSDEGDVSGQIRKLTGGRGARLIFDAVAGESLVAMLPALAPEGMVVVYGALQGGLLSLDIHALMLTGLTLRGFATSQITSDSRRCAAAVAYIRDRLERGVLRPVIDRTFKLDEIVEAHRYLEASQQVGKIVVVP